ncbi:hypothetical protein FIBSPDRAFT_853835 [Athelia psychrophila]|uniref:Uncharacterized protein n=1 Tax=Athelia psychrophila TaxID=1759441 RepID=A0A166QHQ9_9AGAM|nr:hypothetical protein FIBSPDRAFT_853835 [Fibularhizoctonia sp. CBS 109695]
MYLIWVIARNVISSPVSSELWVEWQPTAANPFSWSLNPGSRTCFSPSVNSSHGLIKI